MILFLVFLWLRCATLWYSQKRDSEFHSIEQEKYVWAVLFGFHSLSPSGFLLLLMFTDCHFIRTFIYFMQNGMQKLFIEQRINSKYTHKHTQSVLYTFRYPLPPSPQKFIALQIFTSKFLHDFEFAKINWTGLLNLFNRISRGERKRVRIAVRENWVNVCEGRRYKIRYAIS